MCFRQIISMFKQYKPMKKNTTTIAKSWPKKLQTQFISSHLKVIRPFQKYIQKKCGSLT